MVKVKCQRAEFAFGRSSIDKETEQCHRCRTIRQKQELRKDEKNLVFITTKRV